LFVIVQPLSGM